MGRKILALSLLLPSVALAAIVTTTPGRPEASLYTHYRGSVIAASATLGTFVLPARGFTLTAFALQTTAAAVGAGTVTLRATDGTNVCDASASCTVLGSAGFGDGGGKRLGASGTCSFPPGATLVVTVAASGCASTQPNVLLTTVVGQWN